jgi:hypothetical protein
MDIPVWTLLWILGALILIPFVLGPIFIRFSMRQSAEPDVTTFDPEHPKLPPEVKTHFRNVTETLGAEGFDVVGGLALPHQMPNVRLVMLAFAHRPNKDAAIAPLIYAETPMGTQLQTAYVEIISRYRDKTLVQTNNSHVLGAFGPRPMTTTTQFPTIEDPARLYRLHRAMDERHAGDVKFLRLDEEFRGNPVAYLKFAMIEELEGQVEAGTMYLSESEKVYRPTWKGAFKFVWQELWPWKAIRLRKRKKKAERLLRELEEAA